MIASGTWRRIAARAGIAGILSLAALLPSTVAPAGAADGAAAPDFTGYQQLLDDFLVVTSLPGAPIETGFKYDTLFAHFDRPIRLGAIRRQFLEVPPSRMSAATLKAWAINFYNFLVLETATQHYFKGVIPGAQPRTLLARARTTSVQQIRLPYGKFFEAPLVEIEGQSYSLDRFERHFLFGDFDRQAKTPPPPSLDPRVHFALVCASKGCPPLLPRAYSADSLDSQLDFAVRNALANPRHLRWIPERSNLLGSSLFLWYSADFGGTTEHINFVKRHAPPEIVQVIEEKKIPWVSGFIPWDWSYNLPPVNAMVQSPGAAGTSRKSP